MDSKVYNCEFEHYSSIFCQNIKKIREAAEMTQTEFAELLGVSRGAISYYEKGERKPDIEFIYKICDIFDISPKYILGYSESLIDRYEFADLSMGLSEKACIALECNNTIGHFISSILDHKDFNKLHSFLSSILLNASKNNPKSILYDDECSQCDTKYLGFLFTNMLHEIISDVISKEYNTKLFKGYTSEEILTFQNPLAESCVSKSYNHENVLSSATSSPDSENVSTKITLRKKVHVALGDIDYPN